MRLLALSILAATASTVAAQAVTGILKPTTPNPTGCRQSVPSSFNIFKSELNGHAKRQLDVVTVSVALALRTQLHKRSCVLLYF